MTRARLIAPVAGLALAALIVPAAAAQQPQDEGQGSSQNGGIITETLEPLTPHGEVEPDSEGVVPRGERFQPAPFATPEAPVVPQRIEPVETVLRPGARMRQLDKMTGQSQTVEIAAGKDAMLDRLRVRLEACRAPEDNAEHGTKAYVKIWDTQDPEAEPVFAGWMFAESPALSAMDHPRYDVWVMSCTTSSAEASAASE